MALLPEAALCPQGTLHFACPWLFKKCNSAELILALYCSTCKYHVETTGCALAFISCAICPPPLSATKPLLLDCLNVLLEWHISTFFIIKENPFHIWLSNSEGPSQLEVTIHCWAMTHFMVGYHLFLISNEAAAGGNWQEHSSFFLVGEI